MAYIFISSRGGAGDTSKGDQAYEESILSADITGDITKTLNLNQRNGNTISVSYIDESRLQRITCMKRTG